MEISEVTLFVDFFEVLHVQLFCKVLQLPMCSNTEDELIQQLRYYNLQGRCTEYHIKSTNEFTAHTLMIAVSLSNGPFSFTDGCTKHFVAQHYMISIILRENTIHSPNQLSDMT